MDSNQGIGIRYRANATVAGEMETPRVASLKPTLKGPSRPIRRSAARSSAAPAANAWPVQAMTTGMSNLKMRNTRSISSRLRCRWASEPDRSSARSNPAENIPGRPERITATAESPIALSNWAFTSAMKALPSALTLPSSSVTVANLSSSLYRFMRSGLQPTLGTSSPVFQQQRCGRSTDPAVAIVEFGVGHPNAGGCSKRVIGDGNPLPDGEAHQLHGEIETHERPLFERERGESAVGVVGCCADSFDRCDFAPVNDG